METLILSMVAMMVAIGVIACGRSLYVAAKAKPEEVYPDQAEKMTPAEAAAGYIAIEPADVSAPVSGIGHLLHNLLEAIAHLGHHA